MSCKRGDVVIVWFPHSDQRTFSRRPALVVQADDLDTGIDQVLIARITTNLKRIGFPAASSSISHFYRWQGIGPRLRFRHRDRQSGHRADEGYSVSDRLAAMTDLC